MSEPKAIYHGYRFPSEIISHGVWLYYRVSLSFRDVEDLLAVGDRESEIYELFCEAQRCGTHFLVRTCVDRLAGDGTHTIADEMSEVRVKGLHRIDVRDAKGNLSEAVLEIRYRRI